VLAQSLQGALLAEVTTWPQRSNHRYWIWVGVLIGIISLGAPALLSVSLQSTCQKPF
jgi:hypothetical protein